MTKSDYYSDCRQKWARMLSVYTFALLRVNYITVGRKSNSLKGKYDCKR